MSLALVCLFSGSQSEVGDGDSLALSAGLGGRGDLGSRRWMRIVGIAVLWVPASDEEIWGILWSPFFRSFSFDFFRIFFPMLIAALESVTTHNTLSCFFWQLSRCVQELKMRALRFRAYIRCAALYLRKKRSRCMLSSYLSTNIFHCEAG